MSGDWSSDVCSSDLYPGTVHIIEGGNHSFEVPAAAGRLQDDVHREIAERVARFVRHVTESAE